MYVGLGLFLACLYSPFGWGFTHRPFPFGNVLLSLGYYGAVVLSGIRTIQTIWNLSGNVRWIFLVIGLSLVITTAFFGASSLLLQQTSAHHQNITHTKILGYTLISLAGIVLVKFAAERTIKRSQQGVDLNT